MARAVVVLLVLSSAAPRALAAAGDEPEPARGGDEARPPAPTAPGGDAGQGADAGEAKPAEPTPSLDFDLLPPEQKPDAKANAKLDREVAKRRQMLTLHQGLGLATWGALAATVVVGQLDFNDRFRGGGDTGKYHPWHTGLAIGTSALFAASGLLAVLAPVPYPKKLAVDTATLHKVSMAIATAGMVAQIVLGVTARGQAGSLRERDLAAAHQIVGYTTFGAMTVGTVVLLF